MKFACSPNVNLAKQILHELAERPIVLAPRKVDKPLILYGAGNLGKMASSYFEKVGIPFLHILDSNPERYKDDSFWKNVQIIGARDFSAGRKNDFLLAVCVATSAFSTVSAELAKQGWTDVVPFYDIAEAYRDAHPLGNGWFSGKLESNDVDNIGQVLSRWSDDISRAHHLQFIAWHSLREDWLFDDAPVNAQEKYFISQVCSALQDHEVFLDIGAHHGEVCIQFMQATEFKQIWAIEPDPDNFRELGLELQKPAKDGKIRMLSCAIGEKEGRASFFQGLGYASQLGEQGKNVVEVTPIDQLGIEPTFIKLHLEGWELGALKGGLKTIRQCRPIIATTTYHNRLGLWELPKWLMEHLTGYVFFLRLHSWCGTGAVMYAIPKEKMRF